MEGGKAIKEESLESPCSPPTTVVTAIVASTTASGTISIPHITATIPSGKENRRVGSPSLNTSATASEILTRSRSKVLSKENSHHSRHHYYHHHHHRMSESPIVGGTSGGTTPQSPPMPGIKSNSTATSASSLSHHSHGSGGVHTFGHKFTASSEVAGSTTSARGNRTSPVCSVGGGRRTPSPSANGSSITNNNINNNSGSSARTQSSSSNSSGSSSSTSHFVGESLAHLTNAGARHVVKIKRFLGTLLHFGCEISPEVGDRVRTLVFNLVSGHLSVEEFHHSLQEVTSFPLRPFVLPFLRAHLPLLQREISQLARISKQTPLSFIRSHEQVIIDSASNPGEPCDIFHSEATDMVIPGKRKSTESFYENGENGDTGYTSTPKRHHASLFSPPFFISTGGSGISTALELREYYTSSGYPILTPTSHHSHSHHHESSSQSGSGGTSGGINNSSGSSTTTTNGIGATGTKGSEDEWKNIHVMLNCILSMVEKTKRALSILQNRTFHGEGHVDASGNGNVSSWLRRPTTFTAVVDNSEDFKRQAGEMMAQALRATEDRVAEVKRRAEEAVQDVKRQALVELQRAVAAAEARACEAVASERARLERAYIDSRRSTGESAGAPPMDTETCWNCGRKAHETCSGCNMARYCSSFCQHKDWEHHHTVCGRGSSSSSIERVERVNDTNIDSKICNGRENNESPPINVSNPSPDNVSSVGSNN